eukprot:7267727-Prymnesium_polylepis.1
MRLQRPRLAACFSGWRRGWECSERDTEVRAAAALAASRAAEVVRLERQLNKRLVAHAAEVAALRVVHDNAQGVTQDSTAVNEEVQVEALALVAQQVTRQAFDVGIIAYVASEFEEKLPDSLAAHFGDTSATRRFTRSLSQRQRQDYHKNVLVKFLLRVLAGGKREELVAMLDALAKVFGFHDKDKQLLDAALSNFFRTPLEQFMCSTSEQLGTFERSATETLLSMLSPTGSSGAMPTTSLFGTPFQSPWGARDVTPSREHVEPATPRNSAVPSLFGTPFQSPWGARDATPLRERGVPTTPRNSAVPLLQLDRS